MGKTKKCKHPSFAMHKMPNGVVYGICGACGLSFSEKDMADMFTATCPDCGRSLKNWDEPCPVCFAVDDPMDGEPMELLFNFTDGLTANFYGVDGNCFKLGGLVFEVLEDDEDGYRSSMQDVVTRKDASGLVFSGTPFTQVTVNEVELDHFRGYELTDSKGHVWLKFGTDEYDDYYPTFFFQYQPSGELVSEWKPKPVFPEPSSFEKYTASKTDKAKYTKVEYKKPVKTVTQKVIVIDMETNEPEQPTGRKFRQDI